MARNNFRVLPGFGLTMGFTLCYLSAIVLIPFAGLVVRTLELSWADFWRLATTDRALAAYRLTFGASLIAAVANAVFGALLAWVLVRYEFPGHRIIDAMVDFPFALPTAVAGLTLANLFAANGWLGQYLVPLGIKGAFTPLGVVIALTFVGLPFVVRTLQPVLQNLEREVEEAAATLGAGRLRTFVSVIAPSLMPAVLTGFALAFARPSANTARLSSSPATCRSRPRLRPTSSSCGWTNTITREQSRWQWCCWCSRSCSWGDQPARTLVEPLSTLRCRNAQQKNRR